MQPSSINRAGAIRGCMKHATRHQAHPKRIPRDSPVLHRPDSRTLIQCLANLAPSQELASKNLTTPIKQSWDGASPVRQAARPLSSVRASHYILETGVQKPTKLVRRVARIFCYPSLTRRRGSDEDSRRPHQLSRQAIGRSRRSTRCRLDFRLCLRG